jgi:fibronectin-binding autotransporter adhesin
MKKLLHLGVAFAMSLSSLLTLSIPLAHAAAVTCTWTDGSGQDNNFSTSANWANDCGGVPGANGANVYNLVFPATASGFNPVLDIASLTVGTISFTGNGYDIVSSGGIGTDTLTVNGGITDSSSGLNNEIDLNLVVGGNQSFTAGANSHLIIGNGSTQISLGTRTLTLGNVLVNGPLVGSGSVIVNDPNYPADLTGLDLAAPSPSFTGSVSVNQGALFLDDAGALSAASLVTIASGAFVNGDGGASNLTVQSGGNIAPGHSPGCISATNLTESGTYLAQIGGTTACTGYDQIQVSNTVNVAGGTLQTSLVNGFTPSTGQSFTIINNSGGGPVSGTFIDLAEGATFTAGGVTFQISYVGGDGNDVVLTVVNPAVAQGASSSAPDAPNTGLAAVLGNPLEVLGVSTTAALTLVIVARRLKPVR